MRRTFVCSALSLSLLAPPAALAAELSDAAAQHPDAEQAIKLVTIPKGLKIELWAKEPLLENPVGFAFDEKGRVYVVETFRHKAGTLDNRYRTAWLSDEFKKKASPERLARIGDELLDRELSVRTMDDRVAMIREYMDVKSMSTASERVRLIQDTNGDGTADREVVFADGFNDPLDGIAASVLPHKGDVFFSNIPHLWSLRDTNGDGKADVRKSLSYGYGLRYAFIGHDLHGLRVGPDGKLYFSIGDRGAHVEQKGGETIAVPDTGAVFRCNLDGSELEVFAFGLRNPQDLVFDKHGNLFSGDNNSDGGDRARWVHIVEGSDTGWRVGYQYIEAPIQRGPWNAERMWHERWKGQAAHIVPPVGILSNGPSGVAYHPGTGLSKAWADHFFLVDFKGQNTMSGIYSFTLKEKGASFELVAPQKMVWGVLATDADFGPDGGFYILDWLQGWNKPGKGRIYKITDPAAANDPDTASTKRLLAEGMAKRSDDELVKLLDHPDMRVRQEAQFQLVANRASGRLVEVATKGTNRLARLHALWGAGQLMGRKGADAAGLGAGLLPLLADKDPEVRGQATRVLGDARVGTALEGIIARLDDTNPRVRFFAAMAAGKLRHRQALPALVAMLRKNADEDAYLRHAGVMALVGMGLPPAELAKLAKDPSPSVRLATLLTMRRLRMPEVATFLGDGDPSLVREAALAINDENIGRANDALAAIAAPAKGQGQAQARVKLDAPTLQRVLNANFRQGTAEAAKRVAAMAAGASTASSVEIRRDAVLALGDWAAPSNRDRVTGIWRPWLPKRDPKIATAALEPALPALMKGAPDPVRVAAAIAVRRLAMTTAAPLLVDVVKRRQGSGQLRAESLRSLAALKPAGLLEVAKLAARDPDPAVRVEALRLRLSLAPADGPALLGEVMAKGSILERQAALASVDRLPPAEAETLLGRWLDDLITGKFPPALTLDLLESAGKRGAPALKDRLAKYEAKRPQDDLGPFRETLVGGDAEEGRKVFYNKAEVSCLRCHRVGEAGGDVGPNLAGIAKKRGRQYLLEAVVAPNKDFAPGFESVILTLHDGNIAGGTLKKETAQALELLTPENATQQVAKAQVKARERGASGMPEGFGDILTKRELRDLVEYLSTLK
jgi:quinoprotein glucose dehydrogenase